MANKARIVVVEDEPEISRFLETSLARAGFAVETVSNGATALKICAAHPPDVIILDLGLPDMDGKAVIEKNARMEPRAHHHPLRPPSGRGKSGGA